MSIIKLKKNRKTTTNNNSYYAQVLTTKNRTSKLNLGAYDQKQNMLILDLKNFIFWIKKGAAISGNFNKILKKASRSLQNNKKIAINIKY